jgi:hypothetical protein
MTCSTPRDAPWVRQVTERHRLVPFVAILGIASVDDEGIMWARAAQLIGLLLDRLGSKQATGIRGAKRYRHRSRILHYEKAAESKRRFGQRRIQVFSPKINRRLTVFSRSHAIPTTRGCSSRLTRRFERFANDRCTWKEIPAEYLISGSTGVGIPACGHSPATRRNRNRCRRPHTA